MPKTKSRYQQDLGFTDGRVFATPADIQISGTATLTRNAVGDWSINQAASLTVNYGINVSALLLRRTGFGEDLQEQFGGTGIAGSAEYQGRPDTLASMATGQPITPRTAFKIKGYKLLSFDAAYLITGAALTTHTVRADDTRIQNNVAIAPTVVLATGANGLATAIQANPYVTNVAILAANQLYKILSDESVWIDFTVTTAVAGAYRLYGVDLVLEYNFN